MTPTARHEQLWEVRRQVATVEARARFAAAPVVRAALAVELPMVDLPFNVRAECAVWGEVEGSAKLWLLREEHLPLVPDGTPLVSIMGEVSIVGVDNIDTDTRGGVLAYGVLDAQIVERVER